MDKLRILGLDDDNHGPCFRCEDGTLFENYKELIKFLSKPHECECEVRMFAIVEGAPLGYGLSDYSEEEVDDMFYYLEGVCGLHPPVIHPDFVFELFWHAAQGQNIHW